MVKQLSLDESVDSTYTQLCSQVRSVFPTADMPYILGLVLLGHEGDVQQRAERFLESPKLVNKQVERVLRLSDRSLEQFYETLLASLFLSHPLEPPSDIRDDRFLSAPLNFTIPNRHLLDVFCHLKWCIFGNLSRYLDFDLASISRITRCHNLLSTHVLFEYISPTVGVLHILPDRICPNKKGVFIKRPMEARLPFEFMFDHDLLHTHYNYHHSQLSTKLTLVERILIHAEYPIGRSIGTFYRAASGNVVLVSPSVSTLGYLLTETELAQIEGRRCSLLDLSMGINPSTVILPVIHGIPNPDNRPSYILVPDRDIPYWTELFPLGDNIYLLPFSDLHGVSLPPVHVLIVDNAHQFPSDMEITLPCRHIICLSPNIRDTMKHLMHLCGLRALPFAPLEPRRDLCIFQEISIAPSPTLVMIDPEPEVSQVHRQMSHSHHSTTVVQDYLLRVCAGGDIDRMGSCRNVNGVLITDEVSSQKPFGDASDACMVCLSSAMVNPMVLPCLHVLCLQCIQEIAHSSTTVPRCPCCRSLIEEPIKRPNWIGRQKIQVLSKPMAVTVYVQNFLRRQDSGRLCIITAHEDIAQTYATMFQTCIYGFGYTSVMTDNKIIICSFGAYDRYVHLHCTDILVSDLERDAHGMSKVLHSHNLTTAVCLMRGCADDQLFRQWCIIK
jgi:hypothetical protein